MSWFMGEYDRIRCLDLWGSLTVLWFCYVLLILIRDSVISDRIMGELGDVVIMSIDWSLELYNSVTPCHIQSCLKSYMWLATSVLCVCVSGACACETHKAKKGEIEDARPKGSYTRSTTGAQVARLCTRRTTVPEDVSVPVVVMRTRVAQRSCA